MQLHWLVMRLMFLTMRRSLIQLRRQSNSKVIYATSARERSIEWPSDLQKMQLKKSIRLANERLRFLFYLVERTGGSPMKNCNMANKHLIIPADPEYPVLNIAMSTQVVCYELYQAHNKSLGPWQDFPEYTSEELNHLIDHFNETVEAWIC